MLPKLFCNDIKAYPPDTDGIDIWKDGVNKIPGLPGNYEFYYADTGESAYLGAAFGIGPYDSKSGLKGRMLSYLSKNVKGSSRKIIEENKIRKLLLRYWITNSEIDAMKYEIDTIIKYKPKLNETGTFRNSKEMIKNRHKEQNKKQIEKYENNNLYDPDRTRLCPKCGEVKKCSLFFRNKTKKFGVGTWCRLCEKEGVNSRKLSLGELRNE